MVRMSIQVGALTTGVLNVYAWKVTATNDATLIASTGTETFGWIAFGY